MSTKLTDLQKKVLAQLKKSDPKLLNEPRHKQVSILNKYMRENPLDEGDNIILKGYQGEGLLPDEKSTAIERYNEYQDTYNITTTSDRKQLETLVYWEIMELRYKKAISRLFSDMEEIRGDGLDVEVGSIVDKDTMNAFKEASNMVIKMKEKLGLLYEKKQESDYSLFEKTVAKVLEWGKQNVSERTFVCRHCSEQNILWVNPEYWEKVASKHPHYRGKILFNKKLIELNIRGKRLAQRLKKANIAEESKREILSCFVTDEAVSEILETSPDYTNWLIKKGWVAMDIYKEIENHIND